MSATSLIRNGTHFVNDRLWTPAHERLLKRAASYPEVERILVNPGHQEEALRHGDRRSRLAEEDQAVLGP